MEGKLLVISASNDLAMTYEDELTLEFAQAIVGGYIELATFYDGANGDEPIFMYVNEEGHVKGLPTNRFVSDCSGHHIAGNALLFKQDDMGNEVGLTSEEIEEIVSEMWVY